MWIHGPKVLSYILPILIKQVSYLNFMHMKVNRKVRIKVYLLQFKKIIHDFLGVYLENESIQINLFVLYLLCVTQGFVKEEGLCLFCDCVRSTLSMMSSWLYFKSHNIWNKVPLLLQILGDRLFFCVINYMNFLL